jgi:dipeptidyl aminopeptidase/acylaminoacyl peptidase
MTKTLSIILFMLAATTFLSAQTKLTPELLWKIGRVNLEDVSPNGLMAVYSVTRYDVAENKSAKTLYVVQVATGETRAITPENLKSGDAQFTSDSKRVGFLRGGTLYEVDIDGKNEKRISEYEMNGFKYAPDGRYIVYAQDVQLDKTPAEVYPDMAKTSARISESLNYRHWDSWHDYKYSHLFLAQYTPGQFASEPTDLMYGERFDAPLAPMGGMEQVQISPDGRLVAYTCRKLNGTDEAKSTNADIYIYEIASGKTLNLTPENRGYDQDPIFSPNSRYLAWTSMETAGYEADRPRLMLLDLASQLREELTADWKWECLGPQWATDSKSLYFTSSNDFTYQLYNITVNDKKIKRITEGRHDYGHIKIAGDDVVASKTAMDAPAEIFVINTKKGTARQLSFATKDNWDNITKGKVERRTIRTTDGKNMNVWVVLPPNFDANKKYPALLLCQGGPQSALSQSFSYRWNLQLMANNGYVVVAPCRRGMPGGPEGQAWNAAISNDWGGQAMKDLLSGIDDVKKEPWIDANRLGAVGASFGGYSVYWLAGNHEKRFKAFISHCGMFNNTSWWGTTEEMFFAQHDLGVDYWSRPNDAAWTTFSPHTYIKNWDTPILVIHNEKDFRVPFSEGMQAFQAAQMQGIPSKMLSFPDEGHWMLKPQNSIVWQREFFGWLDKWLK